MVYHCKYAIVFFFYCTFPLSTSISDLLGVKWSKKLKLKSARGESKRYNQFQGRKLSTLKNVCTFHALFSVIFLYFLKISI